jgi:RNase P protein component
MKTGKYSLSSASVLALAAVIFVFPGALPGQTAAAKSSDGDGSPATRWSVQVDQVDPGKMELSNSFQIAIYENLIEELKKTKQFQQVFRDGDLKANETRHLLTLKTNVEKYTPGSETRRAVTTVSGATKLMVRTQLVTREGKVVLERTVNGQVRFFGSNMRATHNLARNVAKAIKQSSRADLDQPADTLAGQL